MDTTLWDLEARAGRPVASAQGSWEAHLGQGPLRTLPPGGKGPVLPGQRPSQAPGTWPQEGAILTARVEAFGCLSESHAAELRQPQSREV